MTRLKKIAFNLSTLTLAVTVLAMSGCAPATVAAPEAYANFNSREGTFALDYPEGWEADGNGNRSRGVGWATFEQGPIKIRIDVSFADSLVADIQTDSDTPEHMMPEALVQDKHIEYYEEQYSGYTQEDGETIRIQLGPTRLNKFAGSLGFTKIKGIRATTMAHDRSVTFLAHCPEAQWETFEPVFNKMLRSMTRGVEGR